MNQFLNSLDVVFDIVKDYEEAKDIIFTKNVKYAPLLKKALGKRLNEIVTEKDNYTTRFGIGKLITVREEPNKNGPEIFARAENGLKKGKSDHFFIANNGVVFIIVKVTPIEDRRYVTGIEFYGNRKVCISTERMGLCLCEDRCNKDWVVEGRYDFIDRMGTSNNKQLVSQICYIQEGARIRNISFKRDNFGFLDIKFHTEEISFKDKNFLLTEACNSLFQDSVLNPLYLFEVYSFTCEYKEAKIIRDIGGRFYSNRLELKCEELKKIVDDLKGEVQVE